MGANTQLLGTNTLLLPTDANGVLTLGMTNQWHFYVITNDTAFTNAAFLTFLPDNLAVPRMGVFEPTADLATRPEADIDLLCGPANYPQQLRPDQPGPGGACRGRQIPEPRRHRNDGLFQCHPRRLLPRRQIRGPEGAEYALMGVFSRMPFGTSDTNGDQYFARLPVVPCPSRTVPRSIRPSACDGHQCLQPIQLRRVIVTNIINHELMTDLLGNLSHGADSPSSTTIPASTDPPAPPARPGPAYIYDDSDEHNVGPDPFLINP